MARAAGIWGVISDQLRLRHISGHIQVSLREDRMRHDYVVGGEIESLLASEPPLVRETWIRLKGWYRDASYRSPPPSCITLEASTQYRTDLYYKVPLQGDPMPTLLYPSDVFDRVPDEAEVECAMRRIQANRSGGLLVIRYEHLKRWVEEASS